MLNNLVYTFQIYLLLEELAVAHLRVMDKRGYWPMIATVLCPPLAPQIETMDDFFKW